jgi:hypothetical protein
MIASLNGREDSTEGQRAMLNFGRMTEGNILSFPPISVDMKILLRIG